MEFYDEEDHLVEDPNFDEGFVRIEEEDGKTVRRFMRYTEEQRERNLQRFEGQEFFDEKMDFLESAPTIQAEQDAAICELYEQNLAMQAESDQAITDLYEMLLEVSNG